MIRSSRRLALYLGVIASALAFAGCAQKSQIVTKPEAATIYVDGAPIGTSPVIFSSRSGLPRGYFVKVEQEGYKTIDARIESTYRADISLLLLIPGIIPYFFSARLEDVYEYPMIPTEGTK